MAAAQSGTGDRMSDADIRKRLTEEQYHVTMRHMRESSRISL
jgi:hypothetical protein